MELLFSTPHGSRLYGLSHAGSDYDRFDVYGWSKFKPRQTITDNEDVTKVSFDKFMQYCDKGVPQYLEAMFSQHETVDLIWYIRNSYRPNMTNVRDTYLRTIKSFWLAGVEDDDFKRRRHAWRLWYNLHSMERRGRFNPTLTLTMIAIINKFAGSDNLKPPPSLN